MVIVVIVVIVVMVAIVVIVPSLTAEWLEHLNPIPGVMGSNPAVSGVISGKLILAAGFIQSTLWRWLAQCFDFDRLYVYNQNTLILV